MGVMLVNVHEIVTGPSFASVDRNFGSVEGPMAATIVEANFILPWFGNVLVCVKVNPLFGERIFVPLADDEHFVVIHQHNISLGILRWLRCINMHNCASARFTDVEVVNVVAGVLPHSCTS